MVNSRIFYRLTLTLFVSAFTLASCGGGSEKPTNAQGRQIGSGGPSAAKPAESGASARPGMITASDITLGPLDAAMADKGETIYDVKCQSCHSLADNRVVGPGWKGVTTRREPHWIMNMVVNTDAMLADDAEAQRQLEECLVRMPNQGLSKPEARAVLEFMRKNDGA